jgi:hypothetical protein
MIDISSLIPTVTKRLKAIEPGSFLDLRTYKRNRSVVIHKISEDDFHIAEDGFYTEEYEGDLAKVRKLLRTLLKKEFPRSNKVRVYTGETGNPIEGLKEL